MNIRRATALFTSRRYFLRSTWTDVRPFFSAASPANFTPFFYITASSKIYSQCSGTNNILLARSKFNDRIPIASYDHNPKERNKYARLLFQHRCTASRTFRI